MTVNGVKFEFQNGDEILVPEKITSEYHLCTINYYGKEYKFQPLTPEEIDQAVPNDFFIKRYRLCPKGLNEEHKLLGARDRKVVILRPKLRNQIKTAFP